MRLLLLTKDALLAAWVAITFNVARLRVLYASGFLAGLLLLGIVGYIVYVPVAGFRLGTRITIEEGASISDIAQKLADEQVIRSPFLFEAGIRILSAAKTPQAGTYVFAEPAGLASVTHRVLFGIYGITPTRVVFPEGSTVREMGEILSERIPGFDVVAFTKEAAPFEGYVYPDTYFVYPDVTPHEILTMSYENFMTHLSSVDEKIQAFGRPTSEVLVMASLLEKEARTLEERRMIAGILWNRIEEDMPLQVDAVFGYINNRDTYSPLLSDLAIDSPYNTYKNKGLPPGPITNPSIESILAAITPATTTDLYYLTGNDGNMHYAQTFAQHKKNRSLYLD
ncbi:MAG: endolytic transglycosylase MltG [Minisyncoccia bacterium]